MSSSAGILGNVSSLLDELEDRAIDGPNDFELGGFDWATEEVLTSLHDHTEFEASRHTQNGSLDEDWLGQIAELVSDISVWEEKAENLTAIANEAYERLKGSSSVAAEAQEIADRLTSDAEANYQISKNRDGKVAGGDRVGADSPFDEVISSQVAYDAVSSMIIKRYILRGDRRPYNRATEKSNERATRHHVGVIHSDADNNSSTDSSSIFALNVGAISQTADNFLRQASKVNASNIFIDKQMAGELSDLKARMEQNGFKSPRQLAYDNAALEAEAALTRVDLLSQQARHSVGLELLQMRSANLVKSAYRRSLSSERMEYAQSAALQERDRSHCLLEALMDCVGVNIDAIEQMEGMWNSTTRYVRLGNWKGSLVGSCLTTFCSSTSLEISTK